MNVLLTCAGRRNYLVRWFREAVGSLGGKVFAADASETAPALREADAAVIVERVDHPTYFEHLHEIIARLNVGLVVSLNDLELPGLAANRRSLEDTGARVVVSDPAAVEVCFDKLAAVELLHRIGLRAPATCVSPQEVQESLERGKAQFPLFVKPRWGSASIGIQLAHDIEELRYSYALLRRQLLRSPLASAGKRDPERTVIIQEALPGHEYGLDIINDLDGCYVTTICKRKLLMRAGETDRAVTVDEPSLRDLGRAIGVELAHRGNVDCDVFMTPDGPVVLEMNPRFGGGYPFSHAAGVNLPKALVSWALGNQPDPTWLKARTGVMCAKYDDIIEVGKSAAPQ